eukprot:gnl/TRDRNA2_/TRDRNA2_195191_c0_seq1.p1 gnl/TRDRNA2_/TRDRNA2_195191_c0~~gnl/TRDRNA2_/TRDRNA2_195191_c0_seq1.p1  ORF type:complete len:230 (+),score=15.45 gnl/TRDRNA2_/TRDRNA2_195191_c0_seq1:84-773(+)
MVKPLPSPRGGNGAVRFFSGGDPHIPAAALDQLGVKVKAIRDCPPPQQTQANSSQPEAWELFPETQAAKSDNSFWTARWLSAVGCGTSCRKPGGEAEADEDELSVGEDSKYDDYNDDVSSRAVASNVIGIGCSEVSDKGSNSASHCCRHWCPLTTHVEWIEDGCTVSNPASPRSALASPRSDLPTPRSEMASPRSARSAIASPRSDNCCARPRSGCQPKNLMLRGASRC